MRKGKGWERKREEKHPLHTPAKVSPCLYPSTVLHLLFLFRMPLFQSHVISSPSSLLNLSLLCYPRLPQSVHPSTCSPKCVSSIIYLPSGEMTFTLPLYSSGSYTKYYKSEVWWPWCLRIVSCLVIDAIERRSCQHWHRYWPGTFSLLWHAR